MSKGLHSPLSPTLTVSLPEISEIVSLSLEASVEIWKALSRRWKVATRSSDFTIGHVMSRLSSSSKTSYLQEQFI